MSSELRASLPPLSILSSLPDSDLISSFRNAVITEQGLLVSQLDHLVEMDRRQLFLEYESLRAYLVAEFNFEEWQAERRIRIARLFRRLPQVRELLLLGKLNPTLIEIALGYAHREALDDSELAECLVAICGMSCQAAKRELAGRYPNSRELPRDKVRPLTAELSLLSCVVDQELLELVDDIKGLLSHSHPGISLGELFKHVARDFRERNHPESRARRARARAERRMKKETEGVDQPTATRVQAEEARTEPLRESEKATHSAAPPTATRAESISEETRFPSQSLEHQMVSLYGYQCSYVDPTTGNRCQCRQGLEKDHVVAWADGGKTELSNLRWVCKGHHRRFSFLRFGESSGLYRAPSQPG